METRHFKLSYGQQVYDIAAHVHEGSETWIMCLHGIQSNKGLFDELLAQPFLDDYSLVAPDLVGFGDSSKPYDFSYDLQGQAGICAQLATTLGIKKIFLIGHSLGGMVATLLLQELEDKVQGIVSLEGNFTLQDAGASQDIANQSLDDFRDKGFQNLKSSIATSGEASAASRLQWLESSPDYVVYKSAQSIVKWSETGKLLGQFADTPAKKLYGYGQKNAAKAARIPASIPQVAIPNSSHFMLVDQPAATFQALRDFLVKN